jgi:hypothetical protein
MSSYLATKYPLLQEILEVKNLQLQATFTIRDVARIFSVSVRAIQSRVASGQLSARDLPGRARFLPVDLENFLAASRKGGARHGQ